VQLEFSGPVWFWRGPAPWHFVTVPEEPAELLASAAEIVTYGWGMVPVTAHLGASTWTTSLWPHQGGYIVPLKTDVRRREGVELDDVVELRLDVAV
jgi:hypothetical protein